MMIMEQIRAIERSSRELGMMDACEILMVMREVEQSTDGRRVLGDAITKIIRKVDGDDEEGSDHSAEVGERG